MPIPHAWLVADALWDLRCGLLWTPVQGDVCLLTRILWGRRGQRHTEEEQAVAVSVMFYFLSFE